MIITQQGAVALAWLIFWDYAFNPNKKTDLSQEDMVW